MQKKLTSSLDLPNAFYTVFTLRMRVKRNTQVLGVVNTRYRGGLDRTASVSAPGNRGPGAGEPPATM